MLSSLPLHPLATLPSIESLSTSQVKMKLQYRACPLTFDLQKLPLSQIYIVRVSLFVFYNNLTFVLLLLLQHVNSLAKNMTLSPILELAESLCYQLGSLKSLPDDLQALIVRPLPSRVPLSSIPQAAHDTVICSPDSRAVPTTSS